MTGPDEQLEAPHQLQERGVYGHRCTACDDEGCDHCATHSICPGCHNAGTHGRSNCPTCGKWWLVCFACHRGFTCCGEKQLTLGATA